ncbi:MAG: GNAT family N-acetyltransferase [Candidatus Zixiibacteriota bacterium]|nr:MAG: GNAT family N-acetyltransferase [candidate division Zixibacteria bacterium]
MKNQQKGDRCLFVDDNCSAEDYKKICKGLIEYNHKASNGMIDLPCDEDIRLALKNKDGNIYGGISGHIALYCFFIEELWIDEKYQGKGYGKSLLEKAEKIAKEKGCLFVQTNTFSFQTPGFYIKQGYKQFAVAEDFPENIKHHYLKKIL